LQELDPGERVVDIIRIIVETKKDTASFFFASTKNEPTS
jgi:hypothetical protein